jgi:hypothetical protein
MMHGESIIQIKNNILFKGGIQNHVLILFLCSNGLCSKVFDTNTKHFPFSDHGLVSTKLKLDDIERDPGIWWGIWKNEFSLNIFYLLKCAKRIRHKLNKLMKSSPIYNKLQHYLIEHACI